MTDNDAFARLKNRTRAKVPARNSSLTEIGNDQKTEISHSVGNEVSQDINIDFPSSTEVAAPAARLQPPSGEVTRRTLRIDRALDEELESLCARAKITRETFIEAAYLACQDDPNLMESVLTQARQRYIDRKRTGERRKFETMQGKFSER